MGWGGEGSNCFNRDRFERGGFSGEKQKLLALCTIITELERLVNQEDHSHKEELSS